ncbi:MAG: hypothetical protein MUO82_04320 [Candidatus Thermoplasmatota archaeon]|nr:hypothetical protein [Candidatus Thermoplasmatota archaeon]
MNKKIIGILVCMLFVGYGVFPTISASTKNYVKEDLSKFNITQQPKNHLVIGIMKCIGSSSEYDIKAEVIFTLLLINNGYGNFQPFFVPKGSVLLLNEFEGFAKLFILFGRCLDYHIED